MSCSKVDQTFDQYQNSIWLVLKSRQLLLLSVLDQYLSTSQSVFLLYLISIWPVIVQYFINIWSVFCQYLIKIWTTAIEYLIFFLDTLLVKLPKANPDYKKKKNNLPRFLIASTIFNLHINLVFNSRIYIGFFSK